MDEVVWPKEFSDPASSHTVHGAWFQVDENSSGYILPPMSLVEVHVEAFGLKDVVALVKACCVNPMFLADHLPKLETHKYTGMSAIEFYIKSDRDSFIPKIK